MSPTTTSRRTPFARLALFVAIGAALLVFLLFVGGGAWVRHILSSTLPQVDGELHVPGLAAPVTVRRDAQGVPHIEAASLDDMLRAQGYVTAQDRLWQMDMARRLAAGEAAEILGSKLTMHDKLQRVLAFRGTAESMTAALPPMQLHQLQMYADGVNAFIQTHQGHLPAEFQILMYKPAPWRPADTMLVALTMAQMLDERWEDELGRERVTARLGPTLARDLYPTGSWRDHPPVAAEPAISDPQPETPAVPLDESQSRLSTDTDLAVLDSLRAAARHAGGGATPGSNDWVVSGTRTASGKPILSNDMHLGYGIPEIWYESELRAPGFHAAGVTTPGLPFIAVGHNDHIAWGFTALGGDTQDLYVEQVKNGEYLSFEDGAEHWRPIEQHEERIHVRGGQDVVLELERTAHGPVVTPMLPRETRTLSLAWTLYDPSVAKGLPLYALDTAEDWDSFRAALNTWWEPTLNAVYADSAGHIGYQATGKVAIRKGGLQAMPTPVNSSGTGEWQGYIPWEQMPSALDPEGGILATANSRVTPDNSPVQLTLEWADPYRNERIWKWLGARKGLTAGDMLSLQTDLNSAVDQLIGFRIAYAIDRSSHSTPRLHAAADLLRKWDGVVRADSPAAAIVDAAKQNFWPAVLGPRIGEDWKLYSWQESDFAREQLITDQPAAWLPKGYANWNDFLTDELAQALAIAGAPGDLARWSYAAEGHTLMITHPLLAMLGSFGLPGLTKLAQVGPVPVGGDVTTVKQLKHNLGPSQRFTIDWASPDQATENIVTGQSEDPLSPWYKDQWKSYLAGTSYPLPFTPAAVAAAAQHTLRLLP